MDVSSHHPLPARHDLLDAVILFVDDEEVNLMLLERILARQGYRRLIPVQDPREVPELVRERGVDLLITDLHMPGLDGLELMARVMDDRPAGDWFPVAVLTADPSPEAEQVALRRGAKDFLTKPLQSTQIHLRVQNLLRTRFLHLELREHAEHLETVVRERTRELESARSDLLERLASAAEFRDYVTGRHTLRVGHLSALLAERMGLDPDWVDRVRRAAPLHDVGKIGIPDRVLLKPGPLTEDEFATMRQHVTIGSRLLARGASDLMIMAEEIARTHHERWDGSGYPCGSRGKEIPLVGRIVAIADVFDTLLSERPYKRAWPIEKAVAEIRRQSGRWFDPDLVEAFLSVLASNASLLTRLESEARDDAGQARVLAERSAEARIGKPGAEG